METRHFLRLSQHIRSFMGPLVLTQEGTYRGALYPDDSEDVAQWRDRIGYTSQVWSYGRLTCFQTRDKSQFVRNYEPKAEAPSYSKVEWKPKYLVVYRYPEQGSYPRVDLMFADTSEDLFEIKSKFAGIMAYDELNEQKKGLDEVRATLRMIATNLSEMVVKELNREAAKKSKPRKRGRHGK